MVALFVIVSPVASQAQYDDETLSYDEFYRGLAPYGQWIEDERYGYLWSPDVETTFRPYYTNGHWVMTDFGNTWVSDYAWGWACFHYGRWLYDSYYGWLWKPGKNWGPAWVSWRQSEGYYGWAPLSPAYSSKEGVAAYSCPSDWWIFLPAQYLHSGNYYRYWYGPNGNTDMLKSTNVVTNTLNTGKVNYILGPSEKHVAAATGKPVKKYILQHSTSRTTRIHNELVSMYRPIQIPPSAVKGNKNPIPQDAMSAPWPVKGPEKLSANNGAEPPFRVSMKQGKVEKALVPGISVNPTAEPEEKKMRADNPYEWEAGRQVKQEYTPRPKPAAKQEAPKQPPSKRKRTQQSK